MPYKHPGITKPTVKSCALGNQVALGFKKPVKPRKERAKETKPRSREEAEFRKEVIKYLRSKGYYVKRIENSICNHLGNHIPDILFFTRQNMFFLELKSRDGILSAGQIEFKNNCYWTHTKYIEARDLLDIVREINFYEGPR